MNDRPLALLAADTDRTQDFVFESARLPEIRGASRQLDDLNRTIETLVLTALGTAPPSRCRVVYAGGGGLLAVVPRDQAADLAGAIERLYPRETTTATITADWRPITPAMLDQGYPPDAKAPFGALVRWAGTWLRQRKESRPTAPFIPALPHVERCPSCQQRPANPATRTPGGEMLCDVCAAKRQYARRAYWFEQFQGFLDQRAHQELRKAYYGPQFDFARFGAVDPRLSEWLPQTVAEIGQACAARKGHVGFIYLDGDGLGRVLETLPTPQAYHAFSVAVETAAREAVFRALSMLHAMQIAGDSDGRGGQRPTIHPFEILTIGGDDIMLITPADHALPVAAAIAQGFTAEMQTQLARADVPDWVKARTYTLSGGVVLADDHNPVRFLRDLAEQLQDSAKAARAKAQAQEGYLDFQVLKSSDILEESVTRLREQYPYTLHVPGDTRALRLIGRPYPASLGSALWQGLQALRETGFPNSQMMQLATALLNGRREATLFYLYQQARDRTGGYPVLEALLRTLQGNATQDPLPWRSREVGDRVYAHETALWDIAELYSYVGER